MLKHLGIFLIYACGAAAVLLYAPQWHPLIDQRAAIALCLFVVLGGGLLHEIYARLGREAFLAEKLLSLRVAQGDALEELSWTRRELSVLREALEAVGGVSKSGKSVDEVIAEVKVLQSLITRLAKSSKAPKQEASQAAQPSLQEEAVQAAAASPLAKPHPLRPRETAPGDDGSRVSALPANANQKPGVLPPVALGLDDSAVLEVARQALRDDRIDLVLQPIVLLPQRKRCAYECFSRLRTTDGFMILPEQYIHLAEREGLVTAIDNMLLIRCIQLIRKVQRRNEKLSTSSATSPATPWATTSSFRRLRRLSGKQPPSFPATWSSNFPQSRPTRPGIPGPASLSASRLADLGCRFSLDGVIDLEHRCHRPGELRNFHFVKVRAEVLLARPGPGGAAAGAT